MEITHIVKYTQLIKKGRIIAYSAKKHRLKRLHKSENYPNQ